MTTNTTERERVIEKVRKLLTLGDDQRNPHELEVLAAVDRAKDLMARHNLTMAEVKPDEAEAGWKAVKGEAGRPTKVAGFEKTLAAAVALITSTTVVVQMGGDWNDKRGWRRTAKLVFFGEEDDVAIAVELYTILNKAGHRMVRDELGKRWVQSHRCWFDGYAKAIYRRAKEAAEKPEDFTDEQAESVALVLVRKEDWLQRQIAETYPNLKHKKARQSNIPDFAAFLRGTKRGQEAHLGTRDSLTGGNQCDNE